MRPDRNYGWMSRIRWLGFGLCWHYDLTLGLAWSWEKLRRRGRFFGFTIGQCCVGVTWARKEGDDANT